ncbi:MAG: UvrB/uvrC motif protein [Lentisphaerae bacterium ADurb.BinA184]|nr:MAG: UvrB/uvrC motif protein [Lentisphaerae bacterium ADurb.BinA184]
MIHVTIANLSVSNVGFVVLLKSVDATETRTLPIFIGLPEAQAIAVELNGITPPRPMTHDLMKSVLDALEARLERIEVTRLAEGTFYARLMLAFEGQELEVDSRPSDAIALALRCKAPIFVAEEVMAEAGVQLEDKDKAEGEAPAPAEEKPKSRLAELKAELEKAVREERYEDAARLRDEVRRASMSTNN